MIILRIDQKQSQNISDNLNLEKNNNIKIRTNFNLDSTIKKNLKENFNNNYIDLTDSQINNELIFIKQENFEIEKQNLNNNLHNHFERKNKIDKNYEKEKIKTDLKRNIIVKTEFDCISKSDKKFNSKRNLNENEILNELKERNFERINSKDSHNFENLNKNFDFLNFHQAENSKNNESEEDSIELLKINYLKYYNLDFLFLKKK